MTLRDRDHNRRRLKERRRTGISVAISRVRPIQRNSHESHVARSRFDSRSWRTRVLLSSGTGDPAAAVEIEGRKAPKPFIFNGKLDLMLTMTYNGTLQETVYSGVAPGFREKKPFPPMGNRVSVSGALAHPGLASTDGLPNLSDSTFQLSNAKGSLLVTFSSSTTNAYGFTISGGTKQFVRADGTTGTAVFISSAKKGFSLTFKTNNRGGQSSNPPPGGELTTLASFNGTASGTNGGYPNSGVTLDSQGNLYGTTGGTTDGGVITSGGTVYEIANGSNTPTTIASFNGSNGAFPTGGVTLDAQGNLYGTTETGGPGQGGTVWEIAKGTDTITTLGSFNGANGVDPLGGVTLDAQGNLYGTSENGGSVARALSGRSPRGAMPSRTLASFNGTNGFPTAGVTLDAQGNLYGTGYESVWELAKGSGVITTLFAHFSSPSGRVTVDAQGNLYGTTGGDGLGHVGMGSVWELRKLANGSYAITSEQFFNGTNGGAPEAGVTLDAQGNLYGTTSEGGAYGDGTLWEIVKGSSTFTTLVSFDGTNGSRSESGVAVDGAGNLYGTTVSGGPMVLAPCGSSSFQHDDWTTTMNFHFVHSSGKPPRRRGSYRIHPQLMRLEERAMLSLSIQINYELRHE